MLKDLLKKTCNFGVAFVLWVFILSFEWRGQTLFARAHEVLVENSLVEFIAQQISDTWEKVALTVQETYKHLGAKTDEES